MPKLSAVRPQPGYPVRFEAQAGLSIGAAELRAEARPRHVSVRPSTRQSQAAASPLASSTVSGQRQSWRPPRRRRQGPDGRRSDLRPAPDPPLGPGWVSGLLQPMTNADRTAASRRVLPSMPQGYCNNRAPGKNAKSRGPQWGDRDTTIRAPPTARGRARQQPEAFEGDHPTFSSSSSVTTTGSPSDPAHTCSLGGSRNEPTSRDRSRATAARPR